MKFEYASQAEKTPAEKSYKAVGEWIKELEEQSAYRRQALSDGREKILSPERREFIIKLLENPGDPAVEKLHEFMVRQFGEEESETLYWIRHTIEEKLNDYHIIEGSDGNIISFSNTQYLRLEPVWPSGPKESAVFVAHIVTDSAHRGKGLIKELYRTFYTTALERAQREGDAVKGITGEAVSEVESLLNKMGRKRIYYEDGAGNVYEFPYLCPPVDMDDDTGEPLESAVPEHFMIRLTENDKEISGEELLRMVKAIYTQYVGEEKDYSSAAAYAKAFENNMRILGEIKQKIDVAKANKLFFMSAEERQIKKQKLNAQGKELYEFAI